MCNFLLVKYLPRAGVKTYNDNDFEIKRENEKKKKKERKQERLNDKKRNPLHS